MESSTERVPESRTERAAVGAAHGQQQGKGIGGKVVDAVENVVAPGRHQAHHGGVGREHGRGHEHELSYEHGRHHEHLAHIEGLGYEHELGHVAGDGTVLDYGFQEGHHGMKEILTKEATNLPKEFETRINVIQRYPEMKVVEETYYVKEIRHEERLIKVPRTRVVNEDFERVDLVPVVREVPKTRIEIVHRVIQEEREVTDLVPVVEMEERKRIETVPRIITEEIEERAMVPVVIQVPKTRTKEVHTGNYLEQPAGEFVNPGHFNLLGKHGHGLLKHKTKTTGTSSSSSSSSSDDEKKIKGTKHHGIGTTGGIGSAATGAAPIRTRTGSSKSSSSSPDRPTTHPVGYVNSPGTNSLGTNSAPSTPGKSSKKKPSLLQRIEAKITG